MYCLIKSLGVTPAERGKGYGTLLFKRVRSYIAERGVSKIILEADPDAVVFWEKMGFSRSGDLFESIIIQQEHVHIPEELNEVPVRVVPSDHEPGTEDHLFAWYRKSDGAAVAKIRITFLD